MTKKDPPRVFALQYREHMDLNKAEEYGEIVFLSRLEYNPGQVHAQVRLEREIIHGLREYRPGHDLILPTGSQPAQIMLGRILERLYPNTKHTLMYWAPRREEYTITAV
jgi:hypothetical protein